MRHAGWRATEFHPLINNPVHIPPDMLLSQVPRQARVSGADRLHNPGMVFSGTILVAGRLQPKQRANFGLQVNFLPGEPDRP
jgi:hypothetical protein